MSKLLECLTTLDTDAVAREAHNAEPKLRWLTLVCWTMSSKRCYRATKQRCPALRESS